MNRKTFDFAAVKDETEGRVLARFATMNVVDSDGDLTLPGAFGKQRVPVSAYGHTSWQGALPVGVGETREQGNEGVADLQFFLKTTHGRDAFETIRSLGSLGQWSYGFTITDEDPPNEEQRAMGARRILKKVEIHEVSPVLRGAGVGTATLSAKCDGCGAGVGSGTVSPDELLRVQEQLREASKRLQPAQYRPREFATEKLAKFAAEVGHMLCSYPAELRAPEVRWFVPDGKAAGYVVPGRHQIHLALDGQGLDLIATVLHEAKHLGQVFERRRQNAETEAEAIEFGRRWAKAVEAAYRWSDGNPTRVKRGDRPPPYPPGEHQAGDIAMYDGRAYVYLPHAKTSAWQRIGAF